MVKYTLHCRVKKHHIEEQIRTTQRKQNTHIESEYRGLYHHRTNVTPGEAGQYFYKDILRFPATFCDFFLISLQLINACVCLKDCKYFICFCCIFMHIYIYKKRFGNT